MMGEDFGVGAARRDVGQTERQDIRADACACKRRRDHHALPERDVVVIERDDQRKSAEHGPHPLVVDAIEPREIDYRGADAAGSEIVGGAPGVRHQHRSVTDERDVAASAQRHAASDLERVRGRHRVRQIERDVDETQVCARRIALDGPPDCEPRFALAARLDGRQTRDRSHRGNVPHRLMRMSGPARDDAGERRCVDDLRLLRGVVVDLLVGARRQEARERMHDRQHALEREAAGRRHHVLLRDAALDEPLRQLRLERFDAAVGQQIGVQHDDLGSGLRQLEQLVAVRHHEVLGSRRRGAHRERRIGERERRKAQRSEPFVHARDQLARGRDVVLQRRRAGVEVVGLIAAGDAFHERHAAPFDRVGDDDLRPIADRDELSECLRQRTQIVAVEPPDFPTESAELVFDRSEIAHRGDRQVRLVSVVVDDDRDLAELVVGDRLQRFGRGGRWSAARAPCRTPSRCPSRAIRYWSR